MSGINRGCIVIYIFMEVLRQTRIQIFVNEGCSFESDSVFDIPGVMQANLQEPMATGANTICRQYNIFSLPLNKHRKVNYTCN